MTGGELVEAIAAAGGVLKLEGDTLSFRVPSNASHLIQLLRSQKPVVSDIVRRRGGRVANFPRCPRCASYALYRENNVGPFECLTCGLLEIDESTARRLV